LVTEIGDRPQSGRAASRKLANFRDIGPPCPLALLLRGTITEELEMLEIARQVSTDETATYALSGEITVEQLERIEALIHDAAERNESIALDLRHVWRVERNAAFLIARHACRPNHQVRVVGVPGGLLEWLTGVADKTPE
jgi:ABC-type transporter Mla MlaB component